MAIAYKSAGAGVSTETSGAAVSPASPAVVDAGDILIIHAYYEGTTTAPGTPTGFTLLHGPEVVETTIGRHWIFGKIAAGTEDGAANALGTAAVTTMRAARCYSFSGRVSGTITDLVRGFAATTHLTDPQMPSVTTTIAGGLAVACVLQNDNNALAAATGATGGTWTEAVAEYLAALTPGFVLQLQTCTPTANPGTVSGGAVAATNDPSGVIAFEIRPEVPVVPQNITPSAPAIADTNATSPTITLGAVNVTPAPAITSTGATAPQVSNVGPTDPQIGVSGIVVQLFGQGANPAQITENTTNGSSFLLGMAGLSADLDNGPTDNKGNTYTAIGTVHDYSDWAGYGSAMWWKGAGVGGATHTWSQFVTTEQEITMFALELKNAGTLADFAWSQQANSGATGTQTSGSVTTTGPAVLVAFWFGASPVGNGDHTATPNNGFSNLEGFGTDDPNGYVQGFMAYRHVSVAGTYDVTWSHTPTQGAQLWLLAFEGADPNQNVTPTVSVATAGVTAPTVTRGAVNVTPTTAITSTSVASPTVTRGSLNVTPTTAITTAGVTTPTVTRGAVNVTPTATASASSVAAPTVTRGAIGATPIVAIAAASIITPTVANVINVTPTVAIAATSATDPAVTRGAVNITPVVASTLAGVGSPTITVGAVSITPVVAIASSSGATPTVTRGVVNVTPTTAIATTTAASPSTTTGLAVTPIPAITDTNATDAIVTRGAVNVTPAVATTVAGVAAPTIVRGALNVVPAPAILSAGASAPVITSTINVTPALAAAVVGVAAPVVTRGAIEVVAGGIALSASVASPSVVVGPLNITPAPAVAVTSATAPSIGAAQIITPIVASILAAHGGIVVFRGALEVTPIPAIARLTVAGFGTPHLRATTAFGSKIQPSVIACEIVGPVISSSISVPSMNTSVSATLLE